MSFYWFDVAGVAVLLAFVAFSWFKGFIREAFSAIGWLGGYFGAAAYYSVVSKFYQAHIGKPVLSDVLGFITMYAGTILLVKLLSWVAREKLGLNKVPGYLNGPVGGLMGALKGALFLSMLIVPLNYFPNMKAEFMEKSHVARLVSGVSELVNPLFRFDAAKTEKIIKDDISKIKGAQSKSEKIQEPPPAPEASKTSNGEPPVVKKARPVVKNKPEGSDGEMDKFVRSLH